MCKLEYISNRIQIYMINRAITLQLSRANGYKPNSQTHSEHVQPASITEWLNSMCDHLLPEIVVRSLKHSKMLILTVWNK
jgi:hypothetical protein